jgi:CRISPR-associated protein Cas1
MKKLLNTLYITNPEHYLALEGETVCVLKGDETAARLPLHNLQSIVTFGYAGASPALMGACAKRSIDLSFLTPNGKFLSRIVGESRGNVLLRKMQYRISDNAVKSLPIAKNFVTGKIFNAKWILERATRDHALRLDTDVLKTASMLLSEKMSQVRACTDSEALRGLEGSAAKIYFACFDDLILQQKEAFKFDGRNRRPPTDNVNALLSFAYTLLASDCASALEATGLDAYVGFLHTDRPGRASLALDLMEELRGVIAERFVLSLINMKMVAPKGFLKRENGAVIMDDDTRYAVLKTWQERKREELTHPFLEEKIQWGLVPYAQAMLLARSLRGDTDAYPPFLWK